MTLYQKIAAILTTIPEAGAPESMLYLAMCESNLDEWNTLKAVLMQNDFITERFNVVHLTPKGQTYAAKINLLLESARS